MNETLRTVDGRCVLRMERRLAHPPEKVWRAVTEPEHLSRWYPFQARAMDPRVGGTIHFDDGEGTTSKATITEFDPPRVFAFSEDADKLNEREGENLLHFELRPDGEGCLLVFTHTFDDQPHAAAYASGWTLCLDAMEAALDDRPAAEPGSMADQHERFVEAFGLDQGTVETTPEGWRVRFDRQLMMQPPEAVWAALTAAGTPDAGNPPPSGFTTPEVPAGPVTAVQSPSVVEYEWRAAGGATGGRVRWELSSAPAGARITLTQTGPAELAEAQAAALVAWPARFRNLVRQVREAGS